MTSGTLGILAGGGPFPGRVAAAAAASRPVFIVAFDGFAEYAVVTPFPHGWVRIGAAGRILAMLREQGCHEIVLVGPVRRPSLLDLRPDAEGTRILARIGRAAFTGDDGLLAAVVRVLGEEGFKVLGAHEILTEALGPQGLMSRARPDEDAMADIGRGVAVAQALGAMDVGQGCVVQQGVVLALEAIEGTDAMLARVAGLPNDLRGSAADRKGALGKAPKPIQDMRVDMPVIGARTVEMAAAAGLAGVGGLAGKLILIERAAIIEAADRLGLYVWGEDR